MLLAIIVVLGLGIGTSKAFEFNKTSHPLTLKHSVVSKDHQGYTFTEDEYCRVALALNEIDPDKEIEATRGVVNADVCF